MREPAVNIELQPRDFEMLYPLAHCYRTTTAENEARRWQVSTSTARKRLGKLAAARWVSRLSAWIAEIPPLHPLVEWWPGDPTPDFYKVAEAAQARWREKPVRRHTVYCASKRLLSFYALPPRKPLNKSHGTHDLAIQQCHDWCCEHYTELEFVGEDLFAPRGHGEGVEDFQLVKNGEIIFCGEFLGKYRASRCRHLHEHVAERGLAYLGF